MAFNAANFGIVSTAGNFGVQTLQNGSLQGAPAFFTYQSNTETLATIVAADYFTPVCTALSLDAIIFIIGSDQAGPYEVSAIDYNTGSVTLSPTSITGDITGPASSTNNAVVLWSGTTGRVIKNSGLIGDSNNNLTVNNFIAAQTSTVSGGTITLTAASARTQVITGSGSTIVVLPDATTLSVGFTFYINNNSSGGLTVKTNGGSTLFTGLAGNYVQVICTGISTAAGTWDYHWLLPSTSPANTIYVSNGIGSGYKFTSATYPSTTTINQLLYSSAANTITGLATANSSILVTSAGGVPSLSQSMPSAVQVAVGSLNSGTGATSSTFWRGDGTWAAPSGTSLVKITTLTASNSATLELTGMDSSTYSAYLLVFNSLFPVSTAVTLQMAFGDVGSGYVYHANYMNSLLNESATAGTDCGGNATQANVVTNVYNDDRNWAPQGVMRITGFNNTALALSLSGSFTHYDSAHRVATTQFATSYESAVDYTKIKFFFSAGNISSGFIEVFGYTL